MTEHPRIEVQVPFSALSGKLRLSRGERDHIAGHALDSVHLLATSLASLTALPSGRGSGGGSHEARKIAALSNLLGDIGWERELPDVSFEGVRQGFVLGELFPVAQLKPWLEEWQRRDDKALRNTEEALEAAKFGDHPKHDNEAEFRQAIADAQTKLGTGALLLARIEKWMASHGN